MSPTRRRPERARRTLLLALGLFAAAMAATGVVTDYVWPLVKFPSLQFVFQELSAYPASPDVVFLGSSRTGGLIKEREMESLLEKHTRSARKVAVLCAAVPAGDHTAQRFVLSHLLKSGVTPSRVVMEISPEFMNWYDPFYEFAVFRQLQWEDLPDHLIPAAQSSQLSRLLCARFVPLYQHRSQILTNIDTIRRGGAVALDTPTNTFRAAESLTPFAGELDWKTLLDVKPPKQPPEIADTIAAGGVMVRNKWLRSYAVCEPARREFRRELEMCRERNIAITLLRPPVTAGHRAAHTPEIDAAFLREIDALAAEYGCDIIDARDWLPDGMFYDTHHAENEGGLLFTRQLVRRAKLLR